MGPVTTQHCEKIRVITHLQRYFRCEKPKTVEGPDVLTNFLDDHSLLLRTSGSKISSRLACPSPQLTLSKRQIYFSTTKCFKISTVKNKVVNILGRALLFCGTWHTFQKRVPLILVNCVITRIPCFKSILYFLVNRIFICQ